MKKEFYEKRNDILLLFCSCFYQHTIYKTAEAIFTRTGASSSSSNKGKLKLQRLKHQYMITHSNKNVYRVLGMGSFFSWGQEATRSSIPTSTVVTTKSDQNKCKQARPFLSVVSLLSSTLCHIFKA